ncbi:MAG: acyl-CoA synthetase [Myxococcales bacterium]|nr:acyl-CoA synthetase [Myxococcales bacterium]MCB9578546.1 acyl-CoA synthetase [Polyangiaceae bacterium]
MPSPYDLGLEKTPANFVPLTPIDFLERAADVHPDRVAVIHGSLRRTWSEMRERCVRLASALARRGVGRGDTVSVLLPNVPAMCEVHFGVPMNGAVLNTLNTRLDAETLAFMLGHAESKVLLVDPELAELGRAAVAQLGREILVVDVDDPEYSGPGSRVGSIEYEALLAEGDPSFAWQRPEDEWDAICLNYTSGTTGNPKGVVYHHRGAYLNAISNALDCDVQRHAVYLWTLPMFHCNGWCFPWTIAARAGVNVCLRKVEAKAVFDAIREHRVTHYCGAPIVQTTLLNAPAELKQGIQHRVHAMVAGAAPPAAMIEGMAELGFELTHVYGLTETYGPAAVCEVHEDWADLSIAERAQKNARQGVRYQLQSAFTVLDPRTMEPVPADGETMGELMFRGNITMKGYLKNPSATTAAFAGGWFHSGDLGVMNPDGYVKIKDRSKDIIISGGENISSIEVEDVLYRHPAVLSAAVVAKPDERWGESPCAFVELRAGASATEQEIIQHCKEHLASFKAPKAVVFGELPRTSTGKVQKYELRNRVGSKKAIDV